jgi:hypothetical protein
MDDTVTDEEMRAAVEAIAALEQWFPPSQHWLDPILPQVSASMVSKLELESLVVRMALELSQEREIREQLERECAHLHSLVGAKFDQN